VLSCVATPDEATFISFPPFADTLAAGIINVLHQSQRRFSLIEK
jgi:hypothetical protein